MPENTEMNLDTKNVICMDNDLIKSKSTLSLNATKLLRLAVMQIVKEDKDFKTYTVRIQDLAKVLGTTSETLYRDVQKICIELLQQLVLVGDGNAKHSWKAFQWCSDCEYEEGTGVITIRMHDKMKPYLIGLSKCYTQYGPDNVMMMGSVYAIRIYELLKMALMSDKNIEEEVVVELSMDVMRKATDTEKKYSRLSDFKKNVIDIAMREINEKVASFSASYTPKVDYVKKGRTVIGIRFHLKNKYQKPPRYDEWEKLKKSGKIEDGYTAWYKTVEQLPGQLDIYDYPQYLPNFK